jgi:hypothetical protein
MRRNQRRSEAEDRGGEPIKRGYEYAELSARKQNDEQDVEEIDYLSIYPFEADAPQ